jgi:sarcosine oxidase subunit gamma
MQRFIAVLGFALPAVPNTLSSRGDRAALWLAPDEWLVVCPDGQQGTIEEELRNTLNGAFGSIVDVSANRTMLEISGAKARDLLARGVPIDLDGRSFVPDNCAQTLLAKAKVIIQYRNEFAFNLYVRTSFASYAAEWLLDSAIGTPLSSGDANETAGLAEPPWNRATFD